MYFIFLTKYIYNYQTISLFLNKSELVVWYYLLWVSLYQWIKKDSRYSSTTSYITIVSCEWSIQKKKRQRIRFSLRKVLCESLVALRNVINMDLSDNVNAASNIKLFSDKYTKYQMKLQLHWLLCKENGRMRSTFTT